MSVRIVRLKLMAKTLFWGNVRNVYWYFIAAKNAKDIIGQPVSTSASVFLPKTAIYLQQIKALKTRPLPCWKKTVSFVVKE